MGPGETIITFVYKKQKERNQNRRYNEDKGVDFVFFLFGCKIFRHALGSVNRLITIPSGEIQKV